ncbi:L,D-transpeptidase family protein [Brevibacillus composti]|uniref:L,D-transpeptidase family protein n=1 Tax=Brevibacillus composti TaxID=2796470 RepID=A0A7T5JPX0_9BACL|nr:L,D-transpeptidase family protein [Brevibacillus composti]QQE75617.1 L,D-transpeptidase family protein [Brevibacillus composti]QUO42643.1 L,D-transpeptidase family protein [Brevibacillus composti]
MKALVSVLSMILMLILPLSAVHAEQRDEPVYVYINLWQNKLYLKTEAGEELASYKIAPGAVDTPSPVGSFQINQKALNWGGGFGSRWLGINVEWGTYGIHGTNRPEFIGRYVSHGCFRMKNRDIEKLYPQVKVGTKVIIDGPIMGHERLTYRILVPGSRGALVKLVQNRLKAAGYYHGRVNGQFDKQTERAVYRFQKSEGLPVTGQIGLEDMLYLGIVE